MNEQAPKNQTPEELQELRETEEWAANLTREVELINSQGSLMEARPKIAEFETMIVAFEAEHPLAELNAIVDLSPDLAVMFAYADDLFDERKTGTSQQYFESKDPEYVKEYEKKIAVVKNIVLNPEDKRKFQIRIAAKAALIPIDVALKILEEHKTNILPEKLKELKAKYERLSEAVGVIRNNKVDHDQ